MAVAVDSGSRDKRDSLGGETGTLAVSSLPRGGLCSLALETDYRAEVGDDLRSDKRTSPPLLGSTSGGSTGVHDQLPTSVDRWHRFGGVSFGGVFCAQYWAEFVLWEALLNERPYDTLVELGTFDGGFSLYLAAQAHCRDMSFRTYDIHTPPRKIPGFVPIDIYAHAEEIGDHMRRHDPVIVLCDGGNKPRELKTFSRYVTEESTLVVHDWGTEFLSSDIPENVEMVHEDLCLELGSISRVFRVAA